MVFAAYFLRRFVSFFFLITLLFAIIFNLIEFFEKLIRVAQVDVQTIFHFICLNFLPSFSDLMPVGSWLAAAILLWEFHQHYEWDTLFMLSIGYKELFKLFLYGGIFIVIAAFFINETIVLPITMHTARFKREKLRFGQYNKLLNKSFMIRNDLFCSFELLDIATGVGTNLILVALSGDGELEKISNVPVFSIDAEKKEITFIEGTTFLRENQRVEKVFNEKRVLPGFFVKIWMHDQAPLLINLIKMVSMQRKVLSREIMHELFYTLLQRLIFYFQIFIYPILTLALFLLGTNFVWGKWLFALIPYPLLTALSVLMTFLYQSNVAGPWLMGIYVIFILIVTLFIYFLRLLLL